MAASNYLPYVKTSRDIIYVSDGTFRIVRDLYPAFRKFPKWLQAQGDKNERKCLSKARYVIYPSRWASESAKLHYEVPSDRIHEIPFGPNIADEWIELYYLPKTVSLEQPVKLIFVSADWERKNGDKAVEISQLLIEAGVDVRLIIVGDAPKYLAKLDFVEYKGFLSKSDVSQLRELCRSYREAHFLVLPTGADAFGIVFSEAQAFGVPPITYEVGGTGSAITHGETGLLLPRGASPAEFAAEIRRYVVNAILYEDLSMKCRRRYIDRANWRRWSELIVDLVNRTGEPAAETEDRNSGVRSGFSLPRGGG